MHSTCSLSMHVRKQRKKARAHVRNTPPMHRLHAACGLLESATLLPFLLNSNRTPLEPVSPRYLGVICILRHTINELSGTHHATACNFQRLYTGAEGIDHRLQACRHLWDTQPEVRARSPLMSARCVSRDFPYAREREASENKHCACYVSAQVLCCINPGAAARIIPLYKKHLREIYNVSHEHSRYPILLTAITEIMA